MSRVSWTVRAVLVGLGLVACSPAAPPVSTPTPVAAPVAQARPQLNVGITNTFSLVPLWVAQQNGLFEKYGVSVNLVTEQGGPANALPAVLNGNYLAWEGGTDSFMI